MIFLFPASSGGIPGTCHIPAIFYVGVGGWSWVLMPCSKLFTHGTTFFPPVRLTPPPRLSVHDKSHDWDSGRVDALCFPSNHLMPVEAFVVFAHWSRLGSFSSNRVARKKCQTQRRAETFRSTSFSRPQFSEERTALTCCSPHGFPHAPLAYRQAATNAHRLMSPLWSSPSSDRSPNCPRNLCSHLPSSPIGRLTSAFPALGGASTAWTKLFFFLLPVFWLINFFLSLKTPLKCHFFKKAFFLSGPGQFGFVPCMPLLLYVSLLYGCRLSGLQWKHSLYNELLSVCEA